MTGTLYFIYALTALVGLVPGGILASGWEVATGERPGIALLYRLDWLTPLKIFTLCVYAPLAVVRAGLGYSGVNPVLAVLILGFGLGWSFLQGVFIMTTVFGFT